MAVILQEFNHNNIRKDLPDIKPGHVVKVYQKIIETKGVGKKAETKERIQVFEGLVISRKGGTGISAIITVRKISGGIGVEKIFPLNTPTIEKIELIKITKTRRAKLNYMRDRVGKATKPKGKLINKKDDKLKDNEKDEVKEKTGEVKKEISKIENAEDVKKNKNKEIEEKQKEKIEEKVEKK